MTETRAQGRTKDNVNCQVKHPRPTTNLSELLKYIQCMLDCTRAGVVDFPTGD